jgi:alpha-glucosidase (family GH31 glycosyl hydrolase)
MHGMMRIALILAMICSLFNVAGTSATEWINPPVSFEPPPWPEWVLRHWVWENEGTTESLVTLVEDYLARDIPVGAVIIDAPWETEYNTFEFDADRYPDHADLIEYLHDMDIRVFLWITSMINVDAPNYEFALENDFFLNKGQTVKWWHGEGSFIDYTNPFAMEWWHGLMDGCLDLDIDGWKCDGTDPYTWLLIIPWGYAGPMTPRDYSNYYYRDFYHYTREKLGDDRVITSRPVDSFYGLIDYVFAPRDVCHAGWVGDQDPTFFGLRHALHNMFESARRKYVNFGSDIGGFRGGKKEKNLFIRWAQLGACSPIMENGGGGEHRPWMYDGETLDIYRNCVRLHHQMIPYLYSEGARCYEEDTPLMQPQPGIWQFCLGRSIFVSTVAWDVTSRMILFPFCSKWVDFWDSTEYEGGSWILYQVPLNRYPVFIRKGAVIPFDGNCGCDTGPLRDHHFPGITFVLLPDGDGSFDLHDGQGGGTVVRYRESIPEDGTNTLLEINLSATDLPVEFMIWNWRRSSYVTDVRLQPSVILKHYDSGEGYRQADTGWFPDHGEGKLWVKPGSASRGLNIRFISAK